MTTKPIPEGELVVGSVTTGSDDRFLSAVDFIGKGVVTMTIVKAVRHKTLVYLNGNKDDNALLVYFKETPKPLKLCKTNRDRIIYSTGSVLGKDWVEKKIKVQAEKVKAFGKLVWAVRVVE